MMASFVRKRALALLVSAVLVPGAAWANACGGPDHLWRAASGPASAELHRLVDTLELGPSEDLYLSNSPGGDHFEASQPVLDHRRLRLQSELGRFEFTLPARVTTRESDVTFLLQPARQDGRDPQAYRENEASILRELVWQGPVQVPPRFLPYWREGGRRQGPVQATLILQGVGNGCMQAGDFSKWILWIGSHRVTGTVQPRR